MRLTIRALRCPPPDVPESIRAEFGESGGRIGRGQSCTLALPDPNRHISREHAEIRLREGVFSLKVVSKLNGVVVNDTVVGPGEGVKLGQGDQILIGDYLLQVEVNAASFDPFAAAAPQGDDPFAMFAGLGASPAAAPQADNTPDWFRSAPAPVVAAPSAPLPGFDHLQVDPLAPSSPLTDMLRAPQTGGPSPSPQAAPDLALPDHELEKFLGQFDPLQDPGASLLSSTTPSLYRRSEVNLPFHNPHNPHNPAANITGGSAAPASTSAPAAWDDDIFRALEQDFGGFGAAPPVAPAAPSQLPASPPPSVASGTEPLTLPSAPEEGVAPAAAPTSQVPAPVAAVPPAAARPQAVAAASPTASGDSDALMRVLASAMGLKETDLDLGRPEETLQVVGELLRLSVDGLFKMLAMRSQLKSELRIEDRTMIASRENNPLKHADSMEDALSYLVDVRQHGNKLFMPPARAVDDAVWDVCAHEMAVMAGTRAALVAALKLFSPQVIEGRIKKTGALDAVLPAFHKSRLWERFLEMYAELEREAEDQFDRLLNQEFARAYAEQNKKLRKKR